MFDQPSKERLISLDHGIDTKSLKRPRSPTMESNPRHNSPEPQRKHRHRYRSSPSHMPTRSEGIKPNDSMTTDRREDEVVDPYFDELLIELRKAFPEAGERKSTDPVSIINIKSMIPTFSNKEDKPDHRLPLTPFHSNLDEALV